MFTNTGGNTGHLLLMVSGIFVFSFVLLLTIGMELTWSVKK